MKAAFPKTALCILAKEPRAGHVKTRLGADIGPARAAELARAFLMDTVMRARSCPWADVVLALEGDPRALHELPAGVEVQDQGAGDLGARQEHVLRRALTRAPRALAIGTDSPDLPRRLLDEADEALRCHDAVLGPTRDGGYYLIGVRHCPAGLLGGLPWSVPETGARTTQRLRERGWDVALLEPWYDVDTAEDLARLRGELVAQPERAPATAALVNMLFR